MAKVATDKRLVDKVRFQLDLRRAQAESFDQMVEDCGLSSRKELFNTAMTLFHWSLNETRKGRKLASYDVDTGDIETVAVPALEYVRMLAEEAVEKPSEKAVSKQKFGVVKGGVLAGT